VGSLPLVSSFVMFLLVSALLGLGMSLSTVATSAYVADIARKEQIGASMGALSSIMDIGHSTGPLVTGIIIGAINYTIGFFASFLLAIVTTVVFIIAVRDRA
jgi:MFS family permease